MLNRHSREDGTKAQSALNVQRTGEANNLDSTSSESLITQHIDIWTTAIERKSSAGRGTSKKFSLYGIKKLRELILELAVRGKLVPQDVNDEPASVLLERIASEKAQLVKEGKLKKQKPLPEIGDDEKPFELPSGWSFVRLGNITTRLGSGSTPRGGQSAYVDHGIPFLRSQNVWNDGLKLDDIAYITHETHEVMSNTKVLGNDVLLNITGASLGRTTVFPTSIGEANVNQHVTIIRLINIEMCKFVHLGLMSPMVQKLVWGRQVGMAIEGLSKKVLEQFEFPIPPLEEQHRIVAKVDELMSLCDALEAQTEASISAHQTLVETLLNTLLLPNISQAADSLSTSSNTVNAKHLNAASLEHARGNALESSSADNPEPSFAESWQRVAEHFDTLFTTEASIDTLKKTILQLAVMGKLVPQDANDEPVSKLLERIVAHQTIRIKNKEIQKPKKVVVDDAPPLMTPSSWLPRLLNELVFVTKLAGFEYSKYIKLEDSGEVPVIRAQNVRPFKPALENLKYVSRQTSDALPRSALDRPSLLVTFIGAGIGDICVFDQEERWHLAPNVAKVEPYADLSLHYLCIYLNSTTGRTELFKSMKSTAQPSLSMTTIREIWVSLPPVEEQHRIVARVDELMALCDQLKARLSDAQTTQFHLTDAIVEQAL
jgi:type I restriction enzyme S subunit